MVYLDQPVGTGFSYGNSYLTEMTDGAAEFIEFMKQFYAVHPELKTRQLYLTGESYGGKYLPLFAHAIFEHNEKVAALEKIPLHSVIVSDPLPSPALERT